MAIVTFESVAQAAEAMQTAGTRPSVRKIIEHIGGGSPNAVLKHFQAWQAGRPLIRESDIELDERISAAIRLQMQDVAAKAAKAAEEKAAAVEDDLQTFTDAYAEAERTIETLQAAVEGLQGQADALTVELHTAKEEALRATEQHAELVTELRSQLANERASADTAAAALTTARVRLEALPPLQAEVEKLRSALAEQQAARQHAEQQAAVMEAKVEAAESRAASGEAREQAAQARAAEAEKDAKAARQSEQQARIAEQAAQARLESAARETESAQKALRDARAEVKLANESAAELRGRLAAVVPGKE